MAKPDHIDKAGGHSTYLLVILILAIIIASFISTHGGFQQFSNNVSKVIEYLKDADSDDSIDIKDNDVSTPIDTMTPSPSITKEIQEQQPTQENSEPSNGGNTKYQISQKTKSKTYFLKGNGKVTVKIECNKGQKVDHFACSAISSNMSGELNTEKKIYNLSDESKLSYGQCVFTYKGGSTRLYTDATLWCIIK